MKFHSKLAFPLDIEPTRWGMLSPTFSHSDLSMWRTHFCVPCRDLFSTRFWAEHRVEVSASTRVVVLAGEKRHAGVRAPPNCHRRCEISGLGTLPTETR